MDDVTNQSHDRNCDLAPSLSPDLSHRFHSSLNQDARLRTFAGPSLDADAPGTGVP